MRTKISGRGPLIAEHNILSSRGLKIANRPRDHGIGEPPARSDPHGTSSTPTGVLGCFETHMKLEYLATGSPYCPLIRLYDFTPGEGRQLHRAFASLATGAAECVEVHHLPFVEAVGNCRPTLIRSGRDQAVIQVGRLAEFECRFTAGTWDNVAGLAEPILEGSICGREYGPFHVGVSLDAAAADSIRSVLVRAPIPVCEGIGP
jgi:hypothetical protein